MMFGGLVDLCPGHFILNGLDLFRNSQWCSYCNKFSSNKILLVTLVFSSFFNNQSDSQYVKKLLIFIFVVSVVFYFSLTVFVLPDVYLSNEQLIPQPIIQASLSDDEISLGGSFSLDIVSQNVGDYGDIHILSAAFPSLETLDAVVYITTYDFSQSPHYVKIGDEIGSNYSGGLESTFAKYPSIESMNRPDFSDSSYSLNLKVTPDQPGIFPIYVKSIIIPHTSESSHYPITGVIDHQNEFVEVFSVRVNP